MSISEDLKKEIKDNKDNWAIYSKRPTAWSYYEEELSRIKCKYPAGFKSRQNVVDVLKYPNNDENLNSENLWDFFCVVMFWGNVDSKNFNKYKEGKEKIIENIKTTIKNFTDNPNIEDAYKIWSNNNKIGGLSTSFFTKVLYFLGFKFKVNFVKKSVNRPFIYDIVMTKNLAFIYLDYLHRNEETEYIPQLISALNICEFNTNTRQIKPINPKNSAEDYLTFCSYLSSISSELEMDIDILDEIIFGVNDNTAAYNFRTLLLNNKSNSEKINKLIVKAKKIIAKEKEKERENLKKGKKKLSNKKNEKHL